MVEKKGRLAIVEDEAAFRNIFKDVLVSNGYEVLSAEDGVSGWELIKAEMPDLVLLDLALPRLHGFGVLQNIREDPATKNIPVVILTVVGEQENVKKGLKLGATDYLIKGFYTPREILAKINEILLKSTDAVETSKVKTYKISIKERKLDATRLEHDMGFAVLFSCPACSESLVQELILDTKRKDGRWFVTHFVCPGCKKEF